MQHCSIKQDENVTATLKKGSVGLFMLRASLDSWAQLSTTSSLLGGFTFSFGSNTGDNLKSEACHCVEQLQVAAEERQDDTPQPGAPQIWDHG